MGDSSMQESVEHYQESSQQRIQYNVPDEPDCLLWAVFLVSLAPVKKEDFGERFRALLQDNQDHGKVEAKNVYKLLRNYSLSLCSGHIFSDEILKTCIKNFRANLCNFMTNHLDSGAFSNFLLAKDHVERNKSCTQRLSKPEVQAVACMLNCKVVVHYDNNEQAVYEPLTKAVFDIELSCIVSTKRRGRISEHFNYVWRKPQQQESESEIVPPTELIEKFLCSETTETFKMEFGELLAQLPNAHCTPYFDEFILFSFLGSVGTIPNHIMKRVGIKNVYWKIVLKEPSRKFIRLLFEINDGTDKRLVIRTIVVDISRDTGSSEQTLEEESEIYETANVELLHVNRRKIDAKVLTIYLSKHAEIELHVTDDNNMILGHLPGTTESRSHQACEHVAYRPERCETDELQTGFEILSQGTGQNEKAVRKIFGTLIGICRNFASEILDERKKLHDQPPKFRESRFHGFIYGTFQLNFKSRYDLNCYAEKRSGAGGGSDLIFISRNFQFMSRNMNALPVVVELKVKEDANNPNVLVQVKKNVSLCLRTFSHEALAVVVCLFRIKEGIDRRWSPIEVRKVKICYADNLMMLLYKNALNSNEEEISQVLRHICASVPQTQRINNHSNYLSRLLLGEFLSLKGDPEDTLEKYVFIYDESMRNFVTSFLFISSSKFLLVNLIELNVRPQDFKEECAQFENVIPAFSEEQVRTWDSRCKRQIDIMVHVGSATNTKIVTHPCSLICEDQSRCAGKLKEVGTVNCVQSKNGNLKIRITNIRKNLCKALYPLKELIIVPKDDFKDINLQAVIQGLFMSKQNTAAQNNQIIKVLSETDLGFRKVANLAIFITDKDGAIFREKRAIVIARKTDQRGNVNGGILSQLIEKMAGEFLTISFNHSAESEKELILLEAERGLIRHNSICEGNFIFDRVMTFILINDVHELRDMLCQFNFRMKLLENLERNRYLRKYGRLRQRIPHIEGIAAAKQYRKRATGTERLGGGTKENLLKNESLQIMARQPMHRVARNEPHRGKHCDVITLLEIALELKRFEIADLILDCLDESTKTKYLKRAAKDDLYGNVMYLLERNVPNDNTQVLQRYCNFLRKQIGRMRDADALQYHL